MCMSTAGPPHLDEAAVGGRSSTTIADGKLNFCRQARTEHQRAAEGLLLMLKLSAAPSAYQLPSLTQGTLWNLLRPQGGSCRHVSGF